MGGAGGHHTQRAGPSGPIEQALIDEILRARAGLDDLRAELAALADPDVIALDDEHDSEGATIGFERARVAGLVRRAEQRVADLERAAGRAAAGSYRTCEGCGGDIAAERLVALPATRLCIGCAAGGERGDRSRPPGPPAVPG